MNTRFTSACLGSLLVLASTACSSAISDAADDDAATGGAMQDSSDLDSGVTASGGTIPTNDQEGTPDGSLTTAEGSPGLPSTGGAGSGGAGSGGAGSGGAGSGGDSVITGGTGGADSEPTLPEDPNDPVSTLNVDLLVYDHVGAPVRSSSPGSPWGEHEGQLHGVPLNYDWAGGARPGMWSNPADKQAVTTWGQIYEDAAGSPVTNVRIQLRNHTLYGYAGGSWEILEQDSERLQAYHYAEDFAGPGGGQVASREESSDNGGGRSFVPKSGFNIHWWTSKWPRPLIPEGLEAFFIVCEIRLVADSDPTVDLDNARYLAGISADYYSTPTESGGGPFPSLSITRHKYITPDWQYFTSYIGSEVPTSVEAYRNDITSRPLPPGVQE